MNVIENCVGHYEDHEVRGKHCIKCGTRKSTLLKHKIMFWCEEDFRK